MGVSVIAGRSTQRYGSLMSLLRTLSAAVLAGQLLGACVAPPPAHGVPSPAERVAAECRVLSEAGAQMTAQGAPPHAGLREGCTGVAAVDARPLPAQTATLRAAMAAELPAGVRPGSRAETVYRRLITRGVPVDVAAALTGTPDFRIAGSD